MFQSDGQFENLVVSNKCKTDCFFISNPREFENLVVSNKCKTDFF